MVVVLFAERSSEDVVWLAGAIARAFARRTPQHPVALALDGLEPETIPPEILAVDTSGLAPREIVSRIRQLAHDGTSVVSASTGRTERTLATFDAADRILLVADLSVPSIRGLQRTLRLVDSLGLAPERTPVVLYNCREDAGISPSEVAGVLSREVFAMLQPGGDGPADEAACATLVDRLFLLS
jgi:MinD-like ATPase involved in chromosome partitioning or flagellar assembly